MFDQLSTGQLVMTSEYLTIFCSHYVCFQVFESISVAWKVQVIE